MRYDLKIKFAIYQSDSLNHLINFVTKIEFLEKREMFKTCLNKNAFQ